MHNVNFVTVTIFKCTAQCHSVCSRCCVTAPVSRMFVLSSVLKLCAHQTLTPHAPFLQPLVPTAVHSASVNNHPGDLV